MDERPVKRNNRKPSFFWQGVLILAPMLVLAKVGALAIWQDKRMAQHDAELRAQDLAEQGAEKLAAEWTSHHPTNTDYILVDFNGDLLEPKPIRSQADPTEFKADLSAEQSNLLQRARSAEFLSAKRSETIDQFQKFLGTTPPGAFAQPARYSLGLLSVAVGDTTNATRAFNDLLNDPSPAFGDAGGDLKTLAMLKLSSLSRSGFDAVCSNAVANPTPLTPQILRFVFDDSFAETKDAAERWWIAWQADELKRYLWEDLRKSFHTNRLSAAQNSFRSIATKPVEPPPWHWLVVTNEEEFARPIATGARLQSQPSLSFVRLDPGRLVERIPNSAGYRFEVMTVPVLAEWIKARTEILRVPEYFGVSVSIGNHDVIRPEDLPAVRSSGGGKGAGRVWRREHRTEAPPALAAASRSGAGNMAFVARVHLIGPELLFETQRERSLWFTIVVGVAALTSIVGFISAYRAFHKQLRLAEMKSNFVSSVSHELRAPIASVRLMAEGLERGKISEPSKQREYFRFITQECRRLSSMIENVLDFARIEQGRKQYEFEPTDIVALVEQTVKLMEPYAAERGVRLESRVEGRGSGIGMNYARPRPQGEGTAGGNPRSHDVRGEASVASNAEEAANDSPFPWGEGWGEGETITANIDGQAIQQALVNLIDNAIKHSPSGEKVIVELGTTSDAESVTNHGPRIMLSVSDHGPGIPAAEHAKIFERFYRLGSELRRETQGVGIGLSIVKHVVEAHRGQVRVESEVGKGSCFTIEIPITAQAQRRREEA